MGKHNGQSTSWCTKLKFQNGLVAFSLFSLVLNLSFLMYFLTPHIYTMTIRKNSLEKNHKISAKTSAMIVEITQMWDSTPITNPAKQTMEQPTSKPTEKNTEKQTENPTTKMAAKPSEQTAAKRTEQTGTKPTAQQTEQIKVAQPTEKTTVTETITEKKTAKQTANPTSSLCPDMTIHEQDKPTSFNGMACHPRMPTEASCEYTARVFKLRPSISICKDQEEPPYKLCTTIIVQNNTTASSPFLVKCNFSVCNKNKDMFIEDLDPLNGKLRKQEVPKGIPDTMIANLVKDALLHTRENGFNFVFLNCTRPNNKSSIAQMLTLLPQLQIVKGQEKPQGGKVNVNVILLDSISRAHFYRSFPQTVEYLRRKQRDIAVAHLLEFELFQAIHGHTHENENAFFSGHLYPSNYTKKQISRSPTHPEILFGVFKRAGYQTMYMEDLCWKSYYGLMQSFKAGGWTSLRQKLNTSNIDSTGITDSSCKILNLYGSNTQFYANKNHQICFNGRHLHKYYLNYLSCYIKAVRETPQSKPLFSFMTLNVAHDDAGVRVQTLDKDLMNFINTMSMEDNTVTFIFADHGNTYTYYQVKMLEGRLEMYHPMMLGVLPNKLREKLGEQAVSNLRTNQHRLFNLLDLRAGLVELSKYDGSSKFTPTGIFGSISKERVCNDLELTKASICICNGWYIPVKNTTMQMAIAEFAIGQLNNKIQDLLIASRRKDTLSNNDHFLFGSCQRLRIQSFTNMRQRKTSEGRLSTTMDVKVQSANILQQDELFTINVESNAKAEMHSLDLKLVTFERISTYGPYQQCADDNIELQLCICNKKDPSLPNRIPTPTDLKMPLTKSHPIYEIIQKSSNVTLISSCLLLIHRSFQEKGSRDKTVKLKVYEFANICNAKSFKVHVDAIEAKNITSSVNLPKTIIFQPRSIYFVTALKAGVIQLQSKLNLHIRIVNNDNK